MQEEEIKDFWSWFLENKNHLIPGEGDQSALPYLDRVTSKWNLSWEIGPGKDREYSLTISPGGFIENIVATEFIVSQAPIIENWEFYSSKQPKENWYLLKLLAEGIEIDASGWTYTLLEYDDGVLGILIKADNLSQFDLPIKENIVEIILTNLLGERLLMDKMAHVDIVEKFDTDKGITEIRHLPKHLIDTKFFKSKIL